MENADRRESRLISAWTAGLGLREEPGGKKGKGI